MATQAFLSTLLHRAVKAFHERFGHPVATVPHVPDDATVAFRLRLVTEEFWEFLDAAGVNVGERTRIAVSDAIHDASEDGFTVDLPAFVDAMGDLDYVIEGTRIVCGVDGEPVAHAIHHANMEKVPQLDAEGRPDPGKKPTKPEDWMPPNIEELLVLQGWTDSVAPSDDA